MIQNVIKSHHESPNVTCDTSVPTVMQMCRHNRSSVVLAMTSSHVNRNFSNMRHDSRQFGNFPFVWKIRWKKEKSMIWQVLLNFILLLSRIATLHFSLHRVRLIHCIFWMGNLYITFIISKLLIVWTKKAYYYKIRRVYVTIMHNLGSSMSYVHSDAWCIFWYSLNVKCKTRVV